MAQNSPLRNRAPLQGPMRPPGFTDADGWTRSDRMAFDQGRRAIGSAPPPPPAAPPPASAAASPAPPAAPKPSRLGALGKWGGRVGGLLAAGNEIRHLAEVGADGRDAVYAEAPRSAGRLAGAWAGAKVGGALGAMTGPAAPIATPAGALIGGGVGYAFGDDVVDAATDGLRRFKKDVIDYTPPADFRTRRVKIDAPIGGGSGFGGPMSAPGISPMPASPAPAPTTEVSPARNRVGADWRAPMQLPAGSKPEGWSLKPVVPNGTPTDWRAPMKLPSNYPKAPEPTAPVRDPAAEAAMRYAAAPDVVQAAGAQDANKAEAAGMRSAARIQDYGANARSTITGNALNGISGDTNELMRRMYNDLTSYTLKGSPSLRAQRAEMWNGLISQANGVTAKGADNAAAADMQGMQDANVSQRAFSDRKNKVQMFNVGTSEERRAGDLDRQQKLIESVLGGGMRRRGEDSQSYADIAKGFGGDYTAAAQSVLRNKAAAGEDLTNDPLATMALTNLSDEVLAGNGRMARRGIGGTTVFGAGADGPVDPNPLNYTRQERGYFDRLGSAVLPWGTKASDYLYVDKAGNKRYRDTPLFSDDPVLDKQIRDRIAAGMGYKE